MCFEERYEEHCKRVMLKVLQKAVKNCTALMDQEVFKDALLLFSEQLLSDFVEVAAQDG